MWDQNCGIKICGTNSLNWNMWVCPVIQYAILWLKYIHISHDTVNTVTVDISILSGILRFSFFSFYSVAGNEYIETFFFHTSYSVLI